MFCSCFSKKIYNCFFKDKSKNKRNFLHHRSKSLELTNNRNSVKYLAMIKRRKTFSNMKDYHKYYCVFSDNLPEYESAISVSFSTKILPPCYFKAILNQKCNKNTILAYNQQNKEFHEKKSFRQL